jgi:hypothetical protein
MIPVKEFHLVHATTPDNFRKILSSGSLLSISKAESNNSQFYEEDDDIDKNKYKEKIFTGLIMPDEHNNPTFTVDNTSSNWGYLILNPQLIEDYAQCSLEQNVDTEVSFPHFCDKWKGGSNKGCIKYDTSKSLKTNLNCWREAYLEMLKLEKEEDEELEREHPEEYFPSYNFTIFGTPFNEVTIQFSKNKKGQCIEGEISLNKYLQAIYVYDDEDDDGEMSELARKYPQYNWIFG